MTSDEVRSAFLSFFEGKAHKIIPSSSLIPQGDPTLLLTSAGMVQFKPYFLSEASPPNPRLASCQKCFRATDIGVVGDPSHLTFFEMLGNFSIGDYFKRETISWAWEFVTQRLSLPPERLWVTIFMDDDESFGIWREIGVPEQRILRFDEKDNFWGPAGNSGPCGPCSEIHYDFGEEVGCGKSSCAPNCDCGRFSEIWNLVFTQYDQDEKGNRTLLPKPNIDTGMGLERTAAVVQGKTSVYETDLFTPLIQRISELAKVRYGSDDAVDNTMRIIAEHSRGITFLISDGVIPSKAGRGYVLRRLLRRAAFFSEALGVGIPFVAETAKTTIEHMRHIYPELVTSHKHILDVIESEVENFRRTLPVGMGILDQTLIKMRKELKEGFRKFEKSFKGALSKQDFLDVRDDVNNAVDHFLRDCNAWSHTLIIAGRDVIEETLKPARDDLDEIKQTILDYDGTKPHAFVNLKQNLQDKFKHLQTNVESIVKKLSGLEVFVLHDTYGFPVELTREIATGRGLSVDLEGFEKEMEKQRERARAAQKSVVTAQAHLRGVGRLRARATVIRKHPFVGYHSLSQKSVIIDLLVDDKSVETVGEKQEASLILEVTPFYGEMGGQVGDTGEIRSSSGRFLVTDTARMPPDIIIHQGHVAEGSLAIGDEVVAEVDRERRLDIARNHTVTHLLQMALRQVLGEHIQQRGSLVAPDRFRFDFSHLTAMTEEEIQKVNNIVNNKIRQNLRVYDEEISYKKAIKEGAIALFDEKYGDIVRVIKIDEPFISAELCGGTHIASTGEIGYFHIISESSIGAGLRRIEAVTGRGAEGYINALLSDLQKTAQIVEASLENVVDKVSSTASAFEVERRERQTLEKELSRKIAESLLNQVKVVKEVKVLAVKVPSSRMEALREMSDLLRERLKSAVIVLGTIYEDRPVFLAAVTPDLVAKGYDARKIVKEVAKVTGGSGGGKARLAQAGGKYKDKLDEALQVVKKLVTRIKLT